MVPWVATNLQANTGLVETQTKVDKSALLFSEEFGLIGCTRQPEENDHCDEHVYATNDDKHDTPASKACSLRVLGTERDQTTKNLAYTETAVPETIAGSCLCFLVPCGSNLSVNRHVSSDVL